VSVITATTTTTPITVTNNNYSYPHLQVPFKVLDAPALQDDFYLNLVDWSSLNVLAVGLGSCVYLWSACTSKVLLLVVVVVVVVAINMNCLLLTTTVNTSNNHPP